MKLAFKTDSDGYRRCRCCDTQLKDSSDKFFIEHINLNEFICTKRDCMKEYLLETHSRLNLILPYNGNPFKE